MTEIEKKARVLYPNGIYERNAYIEGATDQNNKAYEWLRKNATKYMGLFHQHYINDYGRDEVKVMPSLDAAIFDDFKKAMEE